MGKRMLGEEPAAKHARYLVAIDRLAFFFSLLTNTMPKAALRTDEIENELRVVIAHIEGLPRCRYCASTIRLLPSEKSCLESIEKLMASENREVFSETTIEVFVSDGKDTRTISNPIEYLHNFLSPRLILTVCLITSRNKRAADRRPS
jgi:hypothetical protein